MLGLLPALWIAACVAAIGAWRHRSARPSLRDAIVLALLGAGAWSAVGGELLSLGAHLTFWPVLAWWALPTVAMGAIVYRRRDALRGWASPPQPLTPSPSHRLTVSPSHPPGPDRVTRCLVAVTAGLLLATGLIALLTPPNTWDALSYHMPRQVYWMQQGSLAHYPSIDPRELEFPPMFESLSLQVMILAGGDQWACALHWTALLGCVLAASAIARDLGAGARGQAVSALLAATYPAALQQAVNFKNDVAVALWALLLVSFALRVRREEACGPARVLGIGLALGLLLYTKGTGYIFALPLGALLGVWMLGTLRWHGNPALLAESLRRLVLPGVVMVVVAGALNAGHWLRNYEAFGHPIGASVKGDATYTLTNEVRTPAAWASSLVRNVTLHTPFPPSLAGANAAQERWVARLHEALGISAADPRTTIGVGESYAVRWVGTEDEHAGAPMHLLLAVLAPVVLAASRRRGSAGAAWAVLGAGWAMFLLFCVVLKWQPWHTRLHIPIFAVFAPACGVALVRAPGGPAKGVLLLTAVGVAAVALLYNDAKPVLGEHSILHQTREATLFQHNPPLREPMRGASAAAVELRPAVVGLDGRPFWFEYAMQRLVMDRPGAVCRFADVHRDARPPRPEGAPVPDVVLLWNADGAVPNVGWGAGDYIPVAQFLPITVYARAGLVRRRRGDFENVDPFAGWRALEGLGPPHGPDPAWGEGNPPVVRAGGGVGARTRLEFDNDGSAAEFVMVCRPVAAPGRTLEVFLNNRRVYRVAFGSEGRFTLHRIPLQPLEGRNELEIRYGKTQRMPRGEESAVLYSRLVIIPRPEAEPPP